MLEAKLEEIVMSPCYPIWDNVIHSLRDLFRSLVQN